MGGPTWKREVVPDHKFDFVDTREFTDHGCGMRMKYLSLYVAVLISFLVYVSDIFTAITMLTTKSWSNQIFNSCPPTQQNGCVYIPFSVGKWLFFGCIIFSFLLLAYEARKAKKIIASRDISYAFTNLMANNYYSLRSYDHFCFFKHISNSTKRTDDFAFFVFFTFKSWKRLLFADGPRQVINALTLYSLYLSKEDKGAWYDVSKYFAGNTLVTSGLTVSTAFTVLVFAISVIMLIVAGICYIPLLCYIQGNLKEYCCHKVDKRISEIIKRRNKQRLAKAAALAKKEAAGDYSHLKNKKGEFIAKPLPQPTLPNVSLDDDDDRSMISRIPASTIGHSEPYYTDQKAPIEYAADYPPADYPPMPAYNQPYAHYSADAYHQYNPSMGTLQEEQQPVYEDEYGSNVHLTSSAAPFAHTHDPHSSALTNPYSPGLSSSGSQSGLAYDAYEQDHYAAPEGLPPHQQMFHPDAQHHGQQPQGQYEYYHGAPADEQYDYNAGQVHAM